MGFTSLKGSPNFLVIKWFYLNDLFISSFLAKEKIINDINYMKLYINTYISNIYIINR